MVNVPNANRREYEVALSGVDFPASKAGIARAAHDKGGLDTEVLHLLNNIADRTYDSFDDLWSEVQSTFEEIGGLADGGPAAPAPESTADKRAVERAADPRAGEPR